VNADRLESKRDAVKSVAADLVKQSGGRMTQSQAEGRVSSAVERGDRQRENGNR
jgi:Arc/MetJ family transcription regulator